MSQILLKLWLIGNRTLCRSIRSVIILVIKQIGLPLRGRPILLITRMITDRIGLRSVLLPLHIKVLFHTNTTVKKFGGLVYRSSIVFSIGSHLGEVVAGGGLTVFCTENKTITLYPLLLYFTTIVMLSLYCSCCYSILISNATGLWEMEILKLSFCCTDISFLLKDTLHQIKTPT